MTGPPGPIPGALPVAAAGPGAASASSNVVVSATLGDPDLAGLGPLTLRVGQRLLAEVLAVQVETGKTLLSLAGRRIEAQIPPGIRQGEIVRVVVAQVLPDRVVFRIDGPAPAAGSPASLSATRGAAPALDAARVLAELDAPDSTAARAVVQALIEHQQPLTRESIGQLRALIGAAEAAPAAAGRSRGAAPTPGLAAAVATDTDVDLAARAAVTLHEEGLPLTPRALQLVRTSLAPSTTTPLGTLLGELVTTLRSALGTPAAPLRTAAPTPAPTGAAPTVPGASLSNAQVRALQLAVTTPTPGDIARVVTLFTRSPEAAVLADSADVAEAAPGDDAPPAMSTARQNARSLLLGLMDDGQGRPAGTASAAPAGPELPRQLATGSPPAGAQEAAGRTAPEQAAGQARSLIATLHDRIELEQLRAAHAGRAGAAETGAPDGPDVLAILNQAAAGQTTLAAPLPPELFAPPAPAPALPTAPVALSIPLAMGGQFATLQLVVQREPNGRDRPASDGPPAVRASFTLHLRRLGEVGADLRLQGPQVRCRLRAASSDVAGRLSDGLAGLQERLEAAGLDVRQLECSVVDAPAPHPGSPAIELRHVAAEV